MEIKTLKQFNDHYGFWEGMTQEERRERTRQITKTAKYYGDLDEDTLDSEAMIDREQQEFEMSVEADKRY